MPDMPSVARLGSVAADDVLGHAATLYRLLVALLAASCGAGSGAASQVEPGDGDPKAAPAVACKAFDVAAALTSFDGERCPWVLTRDDGVLELSSSAPDASAAHSGEVPTACAELPCDYAGRTTTVGPLVIATQRSPHSEMAAGVHLGYVGADGKLMFVDLWLDAGDDVTDDGTSLGPTHALAPFDCDGKLGLFATPRTVAGKTITPTPALSKREGIYTAPTPTPTDKTTCNPLTWRMP